MKTIYHLVVALLISVAGFSQSAADAVVGHWKNGEGTGIINVFKTKSGKYAGKIVWLKEPNDPETGQPKLDKKNSDPTQQTRPVLGLINMKGFVYNESDKVWEEGTIYDSRNGKEYSCKMELKEPNVLEVRGFIGVSMFGRTDTWVRQVKK